MEEIFTRTCCRIFDQSKRTNTVFSVDSILNIKELVDAKNLMNENYGNQYSHIPPHLAYTIMPFPEDNLEIGKKELVEYVQQQKPFNVNLSDLMYEEKSKFFYVALDGEMIRKHHEYITLLLNKYRENYIREQDLERLRNKDFDKVSQKYLIDYGYARVFENYRTHVTVGNFTIENVNVDDLKNKLTKILEPILNKSINIDNIHAVFHTDSSNNQSEMKQLWDKVFYLK